MVRNALNGSKRVSRSIIEVEASQPPDSNVENNMRRGKAERRYFCDLATVFRGPGEYFRLTVGPHTNFARRGLFYHSETAARSEPVACGREGLRNLSPM